MFNYLTVLFFFKKQLFISVLMAISGEWIFTSPLRVSVNIIVIANEQPREQARVRGGSLIEPCAIVPGAEKNLESM